MDFTNCTIYLETPIQLSEDDQALLDLLKSRYPGVTLHQTPSEQVRETAFCGASIPAKPNALRHSPGPIPGTSVEQSAFIVGAGSLIHTFWEEVNCKF